MKENIYLELHLRYTFVDTFVDTRASAGRVVWFQGWDDQWTAASSWMELSCGLFLSTKMVRWNKGWCEIFELISNWLQNFLAPQRKTALNITIRHFGDQVMAMHEKSPDLDIIWFNQFLSNHQFMLIVITKQIVAVGLFWCIVDMKMTSSKIIIWMTEV